MGHNIRYLHGVEGQSAKQTSTPPPAPPMGPTASCIPKPAEALLQQGIRVFRVLLEAFVVKSDDTLFQMSKNASVAQDQDSYFSALRCLRLNKVVLTQRFEKAYEQAFYEFFSQPLPVDAISSAHLSIVDKETFEIDLAGEMMAKRIKQRCEVEVLNLQARLESVCTYACRGQVMPLEPMRITLIFKQLLQSFELDTKSKLVLLKEFERNVLKYLPELIVTLNQQLIKMGILPTLNMRPEQFGAHRSRVSAQPVTEAVTNSRPSDVLQSGPQVRHSGWTDGSYMSNNQPVHGAPTIHYEQDLYQQFEKWLAGQVHENVLTSCGSVSPMTPSVATGHPSNRGQFSGLKIPHTTLGVRLNTAQLTPVLTSLQQQLLQNQAQITPAFLEEAIHQRAGLMNYVHQQLQRNYQQGYQLEHREHNILGLLTKVFSQVLEQESLPKLVRYALWSLQIPYLKVALQDTHFFINANHPARQLLNLLADAAIQIDLTHTSQDPLLVQIDKITKRVLQEYDQDISLFETLIAEFRGFLALHKRRMDLLQQRLQAAEEGKARRELAEHEVNNFLQHVLTNEVPENVRAFAQQWWWKVLFYLLLKEGLNSDAWRHAQQCMKNLITTVLPKASSIDVEIAKQGLADLIQQLRSGLQWVGCEADETKHLIKSLRLIHSVGVLRKTPPVVNNEGVVSAENVKFENKINAPFAPEIPVLSPLPADTSASFLKPAILMGEWIEYIKNVDEVIRCQLAMHLPSCDKMIFINRIGIKVLECKGSEFREKLAKGECRKLQQSALFDQALRQVIEMMQSDQSKGWKFA